MPILATDVYVGGRCYSAGSEPPPQIADRITNPSAWRDAPAGDPGQTPAVTEPVPEQPNPGPGDDTRIGEVDTEPDREPEPPHAPPEPSPEQDPPPAPPAPSPEPEPLPEAPPRSGKGSGIEAWREFARATNTAVEPDADRAQIIAACETAGLLDDA